MPSASSPLTLHPALAPSPFCRRAGNALLHLGAPSQLQAALEAGLGLRLLDLCADVERFLQHACLDVLTATPHLGRLLVALRVGGDVDAAQASLVVMSTAHTSPAAAQAVQLAIHHIKGVYA
jgi:hypothetical protein